MANKKPPAPILPLQSLAVVSTAAPSPPSQSSAASAGSGCSPTTGKTRGLAAVDSAEVITGQPPLTQSRNL